MKRFLKFCGAALLTVPLALMAPVAQAQVNVNVKVGRPAWGPPIPAGTQFYYIPEIDGYYDLYAQQYIVYQDGQWVTAPALDGYDPYQFHPVVLEYRGRQPWVYVTANRARYPRPVVVRPVRIVRPVRVVQPVRVVRPGRGAYKEGYREGRQQERHEERREGQREGGGQRRGR